MLGYVKVTIDMRKLKVSSSFEEKYPFWPVLWNTHIKDYKEVEIQNWQEEKSTIDELERISSVSKNEGLIKIERVFLSDVNREFFINQSADEEGKLKWFSMRFFDENGESGLEIKDYGNELRFNRVTEEQSDRIIEVFSNPHTEVVFDDNDNDTD
ncbi:hypothetical protein JFL43_14710 [Viridibacillus sp. YIM B01967]|uniref:DUF4178 domain-containing protein n=1 Tax=Viridibacillus soli TaxID=2798301 RepID=A0ABS1H9J2_9BACL|nr:hypothetical protein [Viridibacillus soli]MBK3496091.1 hypothetical protein [Viridibacillus soli]